MQQFSQKLGAWCRNRWQCDGLLMQVISDYHYSFLSVTRSSLSGSSVHMAEPSLGESVASPFVRKVTLLESSVRECLPEPGLESTLLLLAAFYFLLPFAWIPPSVLVFQLLLQKSSRKYFPASRAALKHCHGRTCHLLTVLLAFWSTSASPASYLPAEWTDVWRGVDAARPSVRYIRGQIQCKMSNWRGSIYPTLLNTVVATKAAARWDVEL